jgi:hypothetical protein
MANPRIAFVQIVIKNERNPFSNLLTNRMTRKTITSALDAKVNFHLA